MAIKKTKWIALQQPSKLNSLKVNQNIQQTQDQTLQHLIAALQDSLKPYVIMASPTTLEGTCDVILRAHNANRANLINQGLAGIKKCFDRNIDPSQS